MQCATPVGATFNIVTWGDNMEKYISRMVKSISIGLMPTANQSQRILNDKEVLKWIL